MRDRGGAVCVLALVMGALFACRSAPEAETTATTSDLDRLRALPYVDYAETEPEEAEGVVVHESDRAHEGYSLVTTRPLRRADLIDNSGEVVRSWQAGESGVWEHAELLENGDLLVVGADHPTRPWPDESRYLLKFDWEGEVLWRKQLKAHHDVELTPDGRLSLLTFERRQIPEIHETIETRDDGITILDPDTGDVLDEVSFYEVFTKGPVRFPFQEVKQSPAYGKPWVDLFHSNSAHWIRYEGPDPAHELYQRGNVLVTMRNQDAIAILDWNERRLLWSWGQGVLSGPHHAQVLANGNILVFDNGIDRRWSRVIEMDPATEEVVWEYAKPDQFYTQDRGSAQRLPNGNTLIGDSNSGVAFEVTPDGQTVWRYVNPLKDPEGRRATIVRAIRHDKERIRTLLAERQQSDDSPRG